MKDKIENLLKKTLPVNCKIIVDQRENFFGGEYIKIAFACNGHNINGINGQYIQVVSLCLELDKMDLHIQVFGGNGGGRIYLKPDLNHPKEKYLAMVGVKIPFRKPKAEEKFVLNAIEKFAQNWIKALKDNIERLKYKEYVNYNELLNI